MDGDDKEYIEDMKRHSLRWIELPVSPSAEQFSRVFFIIIDRVLKCTVMVNGEKDVTLNSVIVHETDTGYAQCFRSDACNRRMGDIDIHNIVFSKQIESEWSDTKLWRNLLDEKPLLNPRKI